MRRTRDAQAFARALSETFGSRLTVETDGARTGMALFRIGSDETPDLVIETGTPSDLAGLLDALRERGVGMVALIDAAELRVWDRFAWAFEERDVVEPAECDALGVTLSMKIDERGEAELVVTEKASGAAVALVLGR